MLWLTDEATLKCDHGGAVSLTTSQDFVRIDGRRVLIEPNCEGRVIGGCPNNNPPAGIIACRTTLKVRDGYSVFVRIAGRPVCLDSLIGYTDGQPLVTTSYKVLDAAQTFVGARQ